VFKMVSGNAESGGVKGLMQFYTKLRTEGARQVIKEKLNKDTSEIPQDVQGDRRVQLQKAIEARQAELIKNFNDHLRAQSK